MAGYKPSVLNSIIAILVTSSPGVNGGASLPQQGTRSLRFGSVRFGSVSPGVSGVRPSAGSVLWHRHTCSHPQACHRHAVSRRNSHPSGRTSRFRPGSAPLRSHLVGRRPSAGLAEHRMGGGPSPLAWETAEPVVTSTSRHILSVWVPGRPPAVVRGGGVGFTP